MSRKATFQSRLQQFLPVFTAVFFCATIRAQTNTPTLLTNAADVLSLSPAQADHKIPVLVRGVVTAAEPGWGGQFFVQDATAGVFVENRSDEHPEPGDLVEVKGVSQRGAFAPIISKPTWTAIGTAPLPKAKRVSLEQLVSGLEDGQRVEIAGVVRVAVLGKAALDMEIVSGGNRIHIFQDRAYSVSHPESLIGARVRVRGTVAAAFNPTLRQMMYVVMFVPVPEDFTIEQRETDDPFQKPAIPLNGVGQYRRDILPGQRVHVRGVVTLQRPGEDLFLQDASGGGLQVQTRQTNNLAVGDIVDVVGFPDFNHYLPVLDDGLFQKTSDPRALPQPKRAPISEIAAVLHHAGLVTLDAKLLERTVRRSQTKPDASIVSLVLQSADLGFTAEAEVPDTDDRLTSIPIGSVIEATGICLAESGVDHKLHSMQLLLASSGDVRILQKPSWFTTPRLLVGVGMLFAVLMVAISWSVMVSKKNTVLSGLIRDRESAQLALQQAHDQLEERVKERTAQLKFQITARKESELQFKATLKERTRLAQELHDTVEQSLTGIALQLDTTSKLFETRPGGANYHLEVARNLVSQSQVDVRRSVWDLRSRALEQFDLPGALSTSGKQLTDGTNIALSVSAKGRVRPLSETIEENLLRIAQEAITNVIKHSGATAVTVELDYGPQNVTLQIQDNGNGFEQEKSAGPNEGHFGLLGISERVKRIGGELVISSGLGKGTTIRVQAPIEQDTPTPAFAASEVVS